MEHCPHCDYTCPVKDSMKQHVLTTHKGEKYPCTQCDKVFRWKSDATRHMKNAHSNETYTCSDCSQYFEHFEHKHISRQYICDICSKICKWKTEFDQHMGVHQGVEFLCDMCDSRTVQRNGLSRHIKPVHERIKYPCPQCQCGECDFVKKDIRPEDAY